MTKAKQLLEQAREAEMTFSTWADFSNYLFDQRTGIVARAFASKEARAEFVKSAEYRQIQKLVERSMNSHGLIEGATPKKCGRFVVRLPQTLHEMLKHEARLEGVSLNQLVVFKLAAQLTAKKVRA